MGRTTRPAAQETAAERLTGDLYVGDPWDPIAEELGRVAGGVGALPLVRRSTPGKIRKELRNARDADALLDVRAELQVASAQGPRLDRHRTRGRAPRKPDDLPRRDRSGPRDGPGESTVGPAGSEVGTSPDGVVNMNEVRRAPDLVLASR
jgi:hypothetical protein